MKFTHTVFATLALITAARAATVLNTGDVEITPNFNASLMGSGTNPWLLTVRDGAMQREYAGVRANAADIERALIEAEENASTELPDDERYAFLGAAGEYVWILPEASDVGVITPGISTEPRAQTGWSGDGVEPEFLVKGIPSSTFSNNRVALTLASFSGPGDFFLYRTDGFGNPLIAMRTDDGLSAGDSRLFNAGTHTHFNWAFTEPGEYLIGLQASGTLTAGNVFTESDVTTFRFSIIPEPTSAALLATAAIALLQRRRRASMHPFSQIRRF